MESPPRALGSVALRYRQPAPHRGWPTAATCASPRRYGWLAEADRDGATPDGPTVRSPSLARLEAVLLLAQEPLGSRKLADLANLADGTEARTLVRRINRLYDLEDCAFHVVEVAGGFQLMSRPQFAPWLRRLHVSPVEVHLSAPAMETLAVVAYRQPVLRAEIEAVRGVQCGEILRQLMDRDLVRIVGRSEELGRPYLYGTTRLFLEVFGLRHLDELPRAELSRAWPREHAGHRPTEATQPSPDEEPSNEPIHSTKAQRESNVNTAATSTMIVPEDVLDENLVPLAQRQPPQVSNDEERLDEDYDEEYDEEEEDDDEEEEDEDLEEDEWEEVDDDDWDEEDWDEEEEEEDEEEDEEDEEDWDEDEEEDEDWD